MNTLIRKTRVVAFISMLMVLSTIAAAAPASAAQKSPVIGVSQVGKLALFVYDGSAPTIVPVANAPVVVFDESGSAVAKGLTDKVGHYSVALNAGQYSVTIKADGFKYHAFDVTLKSGYTTDATASLEKETPLGDIVLFVYDSNQFVKSPIANASVTIFSPDGLAFSGYTDSEGMLYASLAGGVFSVNVSAKGHKPYSFDMAVKPGYTLNYEAAMDIEVALGKLGVFTWERSGSVTSRIPVANATVVIYDSTSAPVAKGTTDAYGLFIVELTPDMHTVVLSAQGFLSSKAVAEVKGGEATMVEVQMTRRPTTHR